MFARLTYVVEVVRIAWLQNFHVRCSFWNHGHMIIERCLAVLFGLFDLFGQEAALDVHAGVVVSVANAAFVELSVGVQLVITAGLMTQAIYALIEAFLITRRAIFHLQNVSEN